MENRQYEKAYRDAREALCLRGKTIDKSYQGDNGLRYCCVDGSPLSDIEVFKDAWGDSIAADILNERGEIESNAACCAEGDRLWEEFVLASKQYISIFTEHQIAANRQDGADMARLTFLCHQAADLRQRTRKAAMDHTALHAQETRGSLIMKASEH